ncbi:MAG: Tfp pilus assembly protein PilF [Dolichospermum sp.]
MSESRNRWMVRVVLAFAVVAFVGVSVMPIITTFNKPQSLPQNQANTENQGSSLQQNPKLEDQARGYELVLQKEPENQTALKGLLQARLQLLSQKSPGEVKPADIQVVIEPLEKLARLNPQKSEYGVLLAQAKQQIGDQEGAAQTYRTILTAKPTDLKALQGMVSLQLNQKRPEAAIGLLEESLTAAKKANATQPGSGDVIAIQILLGNVYAFQKQELQAISVYDQAINQEPQDFRPILAKAMLFKQQGKLAEAKPLFDKATALAPAQYKDKINKVAAVSEPNSTSSSSPTTSP